MAGHAGGYPGFLAALEPRVIQIIGNGGGRIESPAYLSHQIMAELAILLHMTKRTGGSGLTAFHHSIFQWNLPIPLVAEQLVNRPVFGHHIVLEFIVIYAVVAIGAGLGFAGLGSRELVAGVAGIAFVLVNVAGGTALGNLPLFHTRPESRLHVGLVVQCVGRTSIRPLILRPI